MLASIWNRESNFPNKLLFKCPIRRILFIINFPFFCDNFVAGDTGIGYKGSNSQCFMLGNESLSVIASARFFSPLEHAGNKTNITVVQTATVMFKNIKCDFVLFRRHNYLIVVVSPIHPPIVTESPFFKLRKNKSASLGVWAA